MGNDTHPDAHEYPEQDGSEKSALFTATQREHMRSDEPLERHTRQRMRNRLEAGVLDLGLALREMERRDVSTVGERLTAEEVDEAIAFLELMRRHAGGGGERSSIQISSDLTPESDNLRNLEARLERVENGIQGLSSALQRINFGDFDDVD